MVGNFDAQIFVKQANFQVSEISEVLIFTVSEFGTHALASCTVKSKSYGLGPNQNVVCYPASNKFMRAWVQSEMEKWVRHGRWGGAHLNHVLIWTKLSQFASTMFYETFVTFCYCTFYTFNSWPMYQLVLCIQVY